MIITLITPIAATAAATTPAASSMIAPAMIVAYLVGTTLLGAWLARRSRDGDSWAVAGGGMGVAMIAAGIAGTRVGGAATYGVAGDVIKSGLWNFWYGVNTFLAMALTGIFFAKSFRRLRLRTVGEVFTRRFGSRRCQVFTSLCVQTEYLVINVIEPFVIAKILTGIFPGLAFGPAVAIAGTIIISYTAMGGLWGNAAANMVHCITILAGLAAVAGAGVVHLGGFGAAADRIDEALAAAKQNPAAWWSFSGAGWGSILGMFFSATIHTPAASVYTNFASAAREERKVIPAFLWGGIMGAVMTWLAGAIGMLTLAKYGAGAKLAGYTSITRLAAEINPWIGGLALAAIMAAVISSGGPILLASATMFVRDWIPGSGAMSPPAQLRAYRTTALIYGALAAFTAYAARDFSILRWLLLGFAMVCPPAIAVGYVLYWRRTTEPGAFWGMAAGYAAGAVWYAMIEICRASGPWAAPGESTGAAYGIFHACFVAGGEGIDPSYATTLIPLALIPVLSLAGGKESAERESLGEKFRAELRAGAA